MIDLAILGLLKDRPMHGYQLSREVAEQLGGLWKVSYGSLYPTLRRLERDGAVEATAGTTTSGGGRRKTVYRITDAGEAAFLRLLEETPGDGQAEDARFRVRLAFFRYLPPETRIRLMERRRAGLEERLAGVNAAIRRRLRRRRPLHARADGTRPRGHRVRHRVAERADPGRARPHEHHRPPGRAASRPRDAEEEGAHRMSEVRIAIVGLGNCASSLVQGLTYYRGRRPGRAASRA